MINKITRKNIPVQQPVYTPEAAADEIVRLVYSKDKDELVLYSKQWPDR